MTRKISLGLAFICMFLFTLPATGTAEVVDRIVAIVNDDIITLIELNKAILPYVQKVESAGYSEEKKAKILFKLRSDMLSRMVDRKLTDQEVGKLRLTVTDKEVDGAIERLKQAQMMTQEDLIKALEQDGIDFAEYREKIRQEILRPKLINYSVKSKVIVTDGDISDYYEAHAVDYAGVKEYHLFNILVTQEHLLDTLRTRLADGDDFKALAREFSEAPNAGDGGDLGVFRMETLSDQLKAVIAGLEQGEHTDVIPTDQGFQIFFLESLLAPQGQTLDQVKDEISKKLYDEIVEEKFGSWLDSLRENSYIKTML
ncbi:MAG: SurA N-terminal domain-containing protein [Desulfobacterium sp.]|nr:SurA N-terminal domain-containing protein [Desulfobacterium sp.]